jgi:tRNA-dihydrouridine synthase
MRKHLGYYLKGFHGASELRERVMRTPDAAQTLAAVEETIARLELEALVAA